jgi:hypothetical protein
MHFQLATAHTLASTAATTNKQPTHLRLVLQHALHPVPHREVRRRLALHPEVRRERHRLFYAQRRLCGAVHQQQRRAGGHGGALHRDPFRRVERLAGPDALVRGAPREPDGLVAAVAGGRGGGGGSREAGREEQRARACAKGWCMGGASGGQVVRHWILILSLPCLRAKHCLINCTATTHHHHQTERINVPPVPSSGSPCAIGLAISWIFWPYRSRSSSQTGSRGEGRSGQYFDSRRVVRATGGAGGWLGAVRVAEQSSLLGVEAVAWFQGVCCFFVSWVLQLSAGNVRFDGSSRRSR